MKDNVGRWSSSKYQTKQPLVCEQCRSKDVEIIKLYSYGILIEQSLCCNDCGYHKFLGNKEDI